MAMLWVRAPGPALLPCCVCARRPRPSFPIALTWCREFRKWIPSVNTIVYVGDAQSREVRPYCRAGTRHAGARCSWHTGGPAASGHACPAELSGNRLHGPGPTPSSLNTFPPFPTPGLPAR